MGWGEVFALGSALVWSIAVILMRRAGKSLPALELNLFKNSLGLLLVLLTILVGQGLALPGYSSWELLLIFLSGFLGIAVADTWYLKALNIMGASRTGIVATLYTPFVILLSALFLGEALSLWQWIGFALVMSGILLVTWRRSYADLAAAAVQKGAVYAASAMLTMAIGIVMVKDILETRSFLWTVELRLLGGVAGMLIFITLRGKWPGMLANFRRPQPWGTVVLGSFLGGYLALILWLAGYKLLPASVAAILNETNSSFIVLLAWLVLGEAVGGRRFTGLGLTLAGVAIMLLV